MFVDDIFASSDNSLHNRSAVLNKLRFRLCSWLIHLCRLNLFWCKEKVIENCFKNAVCNFHNFIAFILLYHITVLLAIVKYKSFVTSHFNCYDFSNKNLYFQKNRRKISKKIFLKGVDICDKWWYTKNSNYYYYLRISSFLSSVKFYFVKGCPLWKLIHLQNKYFTPYKAAFSFLHFTAVV